jgi:succinate dehydrogenase/fumarate reductase flavoprotein subunit
LRPAHGAGVLEPNAIVKAVQDEVFPFDKNLFRTRRGLSASIDKLESLWGEVQARPVQDVRSVVRAREAAAMVATARFMYHTASERHETRGMHKHMDFPGVDAAQQRRLLTGGLDRVWVRAETLAEAGLEHRQPLALAASA